MKVRVKWRKMFGRIETIYQVSLRRRIPRLSASIRPISIGWGDVILGDDYQKGDFHLEVYRMGESEQEHRDLSIGRLLGVDSKIVHVSCATAGKEFPTRSQLLQKTLTILCMQSLSVLDSALAIPSIGWYVSESSLWLVL